MSALAEEWCCITGICSVLRKGDVSAIERLWKTEVTLAMHEYAKVEVTASITLTQVVARLRTLVSVP